MFTNCLHMFTHLGKAEPLTEDAADQISLAFEGR